MELRDFVVTPLVIFAVYAFAYAVRPYVTDSVTRRYYFPALTLKIIGAIALGTVYQFYYQGGDTFAYHTHGSRPIWEAFMTSPGRGIELLFSSGDMTGRNWDITNTIWYYRDQHSFFIIRIASIFDLITFSSYSGTATLFAAVSFVGGWSLFKTFYRHSTEAHRWLAISCLFIPSVIFWGSGILKDTITLSFLGIATWCFERLFIQKRFRFTVLLLLFLSCYVMYAVKVYILMCFLAAAIVWAFLVHFFKIRSLVLRILSLPFVAAAVVGFVYFSVKTIVADDPRYSIDKLAETAMITAYDIRYWTGKDAGSGYSLGELDGTLRSVVKLAPAAVNVSLFRPYLWEVKNPLMIMSAVESLANLLITVFVFYRLRSTMFRFIQKPEVVFCFVFAISFALGVGVSTYNFGTLARYKIPLMPFYFIGLTLVYYAWKRERTTSALAATE